MGEEVSLSVSDTNKLRASLGLKPLRMDKVSEANHVQMVNNTPPELPPQETDNQLSEGKQLLEELSAGGGVLDLLENPPKKSRQEQGSAESKNEADASKESDED